MLFRSLRYGIHYLFPINHESVPYPEYIGMDERLMNRGRPGLEHMPDSPLYPGGPSWNTILGEEDSETNYMSWS